MDIKKLISNTITEYLHICDDLSSLFELPKNSEYGDVALPCFTFAKAMKKSPMEIAKELSQISFPNFVTKVQAVGGYLNFFLEKNEYYKSIILQAISEEKYGSSHSGDGKKCLIEHTSINPNASPHIGRSRNAIVGDFYSKLMRFEGYDVDVHYFVNDIGKQISMLVYGALGKQEVKFEDLLDLYVKTNALVKEKPEVEKEIFDLLYKLENNDEKIRSEFRNIVDTCIKGQVYILNKLGIYYNSFDYESQFIFNHTVDKVLNEIKALNEKEEAGIHIEEDTDGRMVIMFDKYKKLTPLVVTRGDKTSLYPLRDICYTIWKGSQGADKNILVLGEDQKLYFEQIKTVVSELGYQVPEVIHYSFVMLQEGSMSTRNGTVVLLEDFMKIATEKIMDGFKANGRSESISLAQDIAYGAVKYSIQKTSNDKNVIFDWDSALTFEGCSGPYLQYTFARISSIFRKLDNYKVDYNTLDYSVMELPIEGEIVSTLYTFPSIISHAVKEKSPHIIANYAFNLAKEFSSLYHDASILYEENEEKKKCRIALMDAVRKTLSTCMNILGIKCLEEM